MLMGDLVIVSNINKMEKDFCFNKCIWYLLLVVVSCPKVVLAAYSFSSSSHSVYISMAVIWHRVLSGMILLLFTLIT